jgi:hypothetical protein
LAQDLAKEGTVRVIQTRFVSRFGCRLDNSFEGLNAQNNKTKLAQDLAQDAPFVLGPKSTQQTSDQARFKGCNVNALGPGTRACGEKALSQGGEKALAV